jgi:hypothetical protein
MPGCINEPDALEMQVKTVHAVHSPTNAVVLELTFVARKGPICLTRNCNFKIKARAPDGQVTKLMGPSVCGTSAVILLPLYPIIIVGAVFDVADLSGRFEILDSGRKTQRTLLISSESWVTDEAWIHSESKRTPFLPGEYEIEVELDESGGGVLAPLFWRPYSHRKSANTSFMVRESPATTQGS